MTLDQLMLFRFRNIEGVLDNIQSWNVNTCVFDFGTTLQYDYKADTVTVTDVFGNTTILPIKECTKDTLIAKFNCTERTTNRHNLSYGPPKE